MASGHVVRVSDYFRLRRDQSVLDFVDVNVAGDTTVFVDPRAIRLEGTQWADWCVSLLQDFFGVVLDEIRNGRERKALDLLETLHEPNETHLGFSCDTARGTCFGPGYAREVYDALQSSRAVETGLLQDLEDTILLIDGIDRDRISDIATNIIREPLITYTQQMADDYGIRLTDGLYAGPTWETISHSWLQPRAALPLTEYGPLLLVPKSIVRRDPIYDPAEYERYFIVPYLQSAELTAGSELVQLLKNGSRRVTKKDVRQKFGSGKRLNRMVTQQHPEILDSYRTSKSEVNVRPLNLRQTSELLADLEVDWDSLLTNVTSVQPGNAGATAYHRATKDLLAAVFYPNLVHPRIEQEINQGRKRIDIVFQNSANSGFFQWLSRHYTCPKIVVECKNYSGNPANPELDQLSGRFGPNRGRVGFLICRSFSGDDARNKFIQSCRDTANDEHGFIIPLEDTDLSALAELASHGDQRGIDQFLRERFDRLIM